MFRKTMVLVVFLALTANYTAFSQSVTIDAALSNAVKEIAESVPQGTKIAVLNISSDYAQLSNYIIDELIVNLVNTRSFQVVPRSTVELELAKGELDFQYTGDVSDASQKSLGQFLGAATIISGSVIRDSTNSYRLVLNAIDLESFTYQTSYRISIQNNKKMKELVTAAGGGVFNEDYDYTTGQRLGMGALNIFGGAGSLMNGHKIGGLTTGIEAVGILIILYEVVFGSVPDEPNRNHPMYGGLSFGYDNDKIEYDNAMKRRNGFFITGSAVIGAGAVFGFIIPFFHHKPNNTVSQIDFPFNIELASSNNQEVNGLRVLYKMKF